MTEIQKTRDYSLFRYVDGNRAIKKPNLKKLIASVEKDNQLCVNPIIVNKDFEIIDGQHRLEVAKNLQLEIYYIQSETITHQHIIDCNVNRKLFEVGDYINYFCVREKNPAYLRLKEMMRETGLKPKALLTLLLGSASANILDFLKTGKFRFPENKSVDPVLSSYSAFKSYTLDKRIKPPSMFASYTFTRAFRWLMHTEGFSQSVFLKKLDLRWFDLKPQRTSEEWYSLLLDIYNFKNHNKLEGTYDN